MRVSKALCILLAACISLLSGCPSKPSKQTREPAEPLLIERVSPDRLPDFRDDESAGSLRTAFERSLSWYSKIPEDRTLSLCGLKVKAGVMRESLARLAALAAAGGLDRDSVSRDFDVFRVAPEDGAKVLVTGYYEPVLDASLKRGGRFAWPIYEVPSDLLVVELDRFDPAKFGGERLIGRLEKNMVIPYYTRSEIDGGKVLEKGGERAAPLVWLADPVDCFFLHVQGSGVIRLDPGGRWVRVGYAGANGRPYHSIGKDLIESGAISREEMSLQAIHQYLHAHPELRDEIMWKNESYVFFKWISDGPVGSLGVVLTAGRSVASDRNFHPNGAAAFLVSEKPVYDAGGAVSGWERFGRWVVNQDAGGAIKGPGRVDLFCGTGEDAERLAGPMKQQGELYYFIKKGLPVVWPRAQ